MVCYAVAFSLPSDLKASRRQLDFPPTPVLPLISLACLPVIAYSLLFLTPLTMQSMSQFAFKPQHFRLTFPTLVASSYILGTIAFRQTPTWADLLIASLLYVGMSPPRIYIEGFHYNVRLRDVPREDRCYYCGTSHPHLKTRQIVFKNDPV